MQEMISDLCQHEHR